MYNTTNQCVGVDKNREPRQGVIDFTESNKGHITPWELMIESTHAHSALIQNGQRNLRKRNEKRVL